MVCDVRDFARMRGDETTDSDDSSEDEPAAHAEAPRQATDSSSPYWSVGGMHAFVITCMPHVHVLNLVDIASSSSRSQRQAVAPSAVASSARKALGPQMADAVNPLKMQVPDNPDSDTDLS